MLCAQYTCGMKNLPSDLPESLKHMQELLTSKLLQMPMKKLQTLLTKDDLSQVPNKKDLRHVLSSLHEVNQVGTELNVDLSGATIQGLQRAMSGGSGVDSYLKDLQDLEDLKSIGEEIGMDFASLTVEGFQRVLDEPKILERMMSDQIHGKLEREVKLETPGVEFSHASHEHLSSTLSEREKQVIIKQAPTSENQRVADGHFQLGQLLHREGLISSAIGEYQKALAVFPKHVSARHMLDAATNSNTNRASKKYVVDLFDYYAPNYDSHMLGTLKYMAPKLIFDSVIKHVIMCDTRDEAKQDYLCIHNTRLRVLDAGCGTGLAGSLFAPVSEMIVGVDLSSNMAYRARKLGVYTRIIVADILAFLCVVPTGAFNVVVMSDVLGYIGDVRTLIRSMSNLLQPGGLLALTVEVIDEAVDKNFVLDSLTGRFKHKPEYLHSTALENTLVLVESSEVELRLQDRVGVLGQLMVFRKPG
jgi:predicted TPR repeat methyltransferase